MEQYGKRWEGLSKQMDEKVAKQLDNDERMDIAECALLVSYMEFLTNCIKIV